MHCTLFFKCSCDLDFFNIGVDVKERYSHLEILKLAFINLLSCLILVVIVDI